MHECTTLAHLHISTSAHQHINTSAHQHINCSRFSRKMRFRGDVALIGLLILIDWNE
jgi:hypothetical protein